MDLAIVVNVDPVASIFEIRCLSWSVNRLYCIMRKYWNKNFYILYLQIEVKYGNLPDFAFVNPSNPWNLLRAYSPPIGGKIRYFRVLLLPHHSPGCSEPPNRLHPRSPVFWLPHPFVNPCFLHTP